MAMANKLDPKDYGKGVPNTMAEIQNYLRNRLPLDSNVPLEKLLESIKLQKVCTDPQSNSLPFFFRQPLTSIRFAFLIRFAISLSGKVLTQDQARHKRDFVGGTAWWCIRKVHRFLALFHYSACPSMLTFDGTLELLITRYPNLEDVPIGLYQEIFGTKGESTPKNLPGQGLRKRGGAESGSRISGMEIDERPIPIFPDLWEDVIELVKCSYYRGRLLEDSRNGPPIQHLGVIMDGNRRYSRIRGLSTVTEGHKVGAFKLLQVMSWAFSVGIQNLTVWALSHDNLKRGRDELDPLFVMITDYINEMMMGDVPFALLNVRFRVIGDRSILPDQLNETIEKAEAATANFKFNLQLALGYGGRSEILRATKMALDNKIKQGLSSNEAIATITEADMSQNIYSAQLGLPRIGSIFRPGGEHRLSGFALWESQHAELAIVDENWPALKQSTFLRSVLDLSKRSRRLGV